PAPNGPIERCSRGVATFTRGCSVRAASRVSKACAGEAPGAAAPSVAAPGAAAPWALDGAAGEGGAGLVAGPVVAGAVTAVPPEGTGGCGGRLRSNPDLKGGQSSSQKSIAFKGMGCFLFLWFVLGPGALVVKVFT